MIAQGMSARLKYSSMFATIRDPCQSLTIIDKQVEATIFACMSAKKLGPHLVFQNDAYRIESFFEGRPLSVWEMRNPVIMEATVKEIFKMHNDSGAAEALE